MKSFRSKPAARTRSAAPCDDRSALTEIACKPTHLWSELCHVKVNIAQAKAKLSAYLAATAGVRPW